MRHVGVAVEIEAAEPIVWALLTDLGCWPEWGPSIRRVASASDHVTAGVTGRLAAENQRSLGIILDQAGKAFSFDFDKLFVQVDRLSLEKCR